MRKFLLLSLHEYQKEKINKSFYNFITRSDRVLSLSLSLSQQKKKKKKKQEKKGKGKKERQEQKTRKKRLLDINHLRCSGGIQTWTSTTLHVSLRLIPSFNRSRE